MCRQLRVLLKWDGVLLFTYDMLMQANWPPKDTTRTFSQQLFQHLLPMSWCTFQIRLLSPFWSCLFFFFFSPGIGAPRGFPGGSTVQNLRIHLPIQGTWVWPLGREDLLEKEMATHSSILGWEIPWTEEPGGLQPLGSQRVRYNLVT